MQTRLAMPCLACYNRGMGSPISPKRIAALCFLLLFTLCVVPLATKAQKEEKKEKELVFGGALDPFNRNTSGTGMGAADIAEVQQKVIDEVKKLYGFTITVKVYPSLKFLFKAIQDKTVDFPGGGFMITLL